MDYVVFPILGLGNGAVFAALALALVLTYKSSGVINFATGAIALYAAYTYAFLREGQFLFPLPFLPSKLHLGFTPDIWLALPMSLVVSAIFGTLLYLIVFRPLRSAPSVAKAVASLGIMVLLQNLLAQRAGTLPISTPRIFPAGTAKIIDINVNVQVLWLAATLLVITIVLWAGYRFTPFGLATEAVAESEKGALVIGLRPGRIAAGNWAISAVVAGLGGILIAPIAPISPVSYTLYVVPALAAALVGGFSSLPIAVVAAFGIGAANAEIADIQTKYSWSWLSVTAGSAIIPLLLIFLYLVFRGRPLPSRGAVILQSIGRAPRPRMVLTPMVLGSALAVVGLLVTSGGTRGALTTTFILAIVALSMVVVTGYAGQVSLAQVTLAGAGAFALSPLIRVWHVPFPFAPIIAAMVAMLIGVVVGLPALRIRGLPIAVVTLSLAVMLDAFWFSNASFTQNKTTVKDPHLFGANLAVGTGVTQNRIQFSFLCLVVLVLVALAVVFLRRSRLGAAMLAVRANERSAAAAGIDVARTKILAFAMGGFIAGLSGCLLAYQQTQANESQFGPLFGLGLFATVYLSGITSVLGALIAGLIASGGILFTLVNSHVDLGLWYGVALGAVLVFNVILKPEGIAGDFHRLAARLLPARRIVDDLDAAADMALSEAALAVQPEAVDTGAGELGAAPILRLRDVSVTYGGIHAVENVSFDVPQGRIVGLIGPNGAGKTSLIDAISGFARASGEINFDGSNIGTLKPHKRVRRGLGRTFQGIELYEDLSILDSVTIGEEAAVHATGRSHTHNDTNPFTDSEDICRLLGLGAGGLHRSTRQASQGHRQLVAVARALAGRPVMVLLDEPAGGLDSNESHLLGQRLRQIRNLGITILIVDHDMHLVLSVCDEVHVLDFGRLIASGSPEEIRSNAAVGAAYLGDLSAEGAVIE